MFEYMPKIYLASTFDSYVRSMNINLRQTLQEYGMFPILPQHLSPGNPQRNMDGGMLATNLQMRRGELAVRGGRWCEEMMRISDGCIVILNRMQQDSSWEAGFIHAIDKPVIALFYDDDLTDPLSDLKDNWMVRLTRFIDITKFPSSEGNTAITLLRSEIYKRESIF